LLARLPHWDSRFLWYTLAIVAALLVGAYLIWLTDRWRKQAQQPHRASGDQLAHFRRLYEQGEFSAEEFARIRGMLTGRMIKEMEKPPPPETQPQAQEPPSLPDPEA
jgi:hypothetical protein